MRSVEDLTAAARIRDAAIRLWGEQGFGASVRAIADAAGVSPGLVIHHYGSKDGLREAVDQYLLEYIRSEKSRTITSNDPRVWLDALDEIESFAPMVRYLLHSVRSGGEPGRAFLQRSIADAEQYLEDGIRAGTIKPSRNPKGRALWLSLNGLGALTIYVQMHPDEDLRTVLRRYSDELIFPAIEIYTEGLLTDSTMLDAFAAQQKDSANEGDTK
ncbi:helix-turn-helix transcriptional regulator [Mycobacterium sp. CBMA271]|uniref:TetR/AcrR family transcriptional regulator n=1 Tax=unclassified Mycobacteroides TaxID=2618759 RepID=UPI0012DC91B0|nr:MULTISPECIES: TetR family transcriptional regulator [unclassified Mycobacteroides]MUM16594.1 TetR family transcriptional regulator [Mycobacteroides sp. CBMA 326]MUM22098.1 helix-turn-helix transcriptional regulator [Mycobacteroides sp. CBMA 271]